MASASPTSGQAPLPVDFSSAGSSDPEGAPLSYSWTFGDGTSTQANPTHTYATPGQYVARLTVSDGTSTAVSSDLTIRVGTLPRRPFSPPTGTFFRAGDVITYSGSATDAGGRATPGERLLLDDPLPPRLAHPSGGGPFTNTTSGTLPIPTSGHSFDGATNYEIVLTVTDSTGLSASTSVTVFPDKVNMTYDTVPSGLTLTVDGISRQTPFVVDDLKGFQRTITAPNQSNGGLRTPSPRGPTGSQSHGVVVPNVDQSLVATFQATSGPGASSRLTPSTRAAARVSPTPPGWEHRLDRERDLDDRRQYGNALSFNGSSARVTVPDSPSLRLTNGMTLEAWVFPTTVNSAWRDVIYKGSDDYYLEATSSNSGRPVVGGIFGGTYGETYGTSNLAANAWTHLARPTTGRSCDSTSTARRSRAPPGRAPSKPPPGR